MALPLSTNTVYTTSDPIKSVDLTQIQDCIVAGAHGTGTTNHHMGAAAATNASVNGSGELETTGSGAANLYTLAPRVGDVLTGGRLRLKGNGTVDITHARVWRKQVDGTLDELVDEPLLNVAASWA